MIAWDLSCYHRNAIPKMRLAIKQHKIIVFVSGLSISPERVSAQSKHGCLHFAFSDITLILHNELKGLGLTLRVQFYANECNEGRDANPNPKSAILR